MLVPVSTLEDSQSDSGPDEDHRNAVYDVLGLESKNSHTLSPIRSSFGEDGPGGKVKGIQDTPYMINELARASCVSFAGPVLVPPSPGVPFKRRPLGAGTICSEAHETPAPLSLRGECFRALSTGAESARFCTTGSKYV